MESEIIVCYELFDIFRSEYITISYQSFGDFINTKDLGVNSVDTVNDLYEVIDEKKWFLTRIKYGI
jgi:hypothetical protein